MECNCGGMLIDREVVEDKEVVTEYKRCSSCGRVLIIGGKITMQCSCGGKMLRNKRITNEGVTEYDKCSICTWISIISSTSPTTVAKALRHNSEVMRRTIKGEAQE